MTFYKLTIITLFSLITSLVFAQLDTTSYAVGASVAQRLLKQGADDLDYQSFMTAFVKVMDGDTLFLDQQEIDRLNYEYYRSQKNKMYKKQQEEAEAFLRENAARPEVMTTASGLQYEILTDSDGPKPTAQNTVTVHYEGKLLDGTLFDSSVARGEPMSFALKRVIKGWTEGVQLMGTGAKYRFYVPSALGYGDRGAGGKIPPFATLIFDIELLDWK